MSSFSLSSSLELMLLLTHRVAARVINSMSRIVKSPFTTAVILKDGRTIKGFHRILLFTAVTLTDVPYIYI